jgi:hypothetical protein
MSKNNEAEQAQTLPTNVKLVLRQVVQVEDVVHVLQTGMQARQLEPSK